MSPEEQLITKQIILARMVLLWGGGIIIYVSLYNGWLLILSISNHKEKANRYVSCNVTLLEASCLHSACPDYDSYFVGNRRI